MLRDDTKQRYIYQCFLQQNSALNVLSQLTTSFQVFLHNTWWRQQIETFSALLAICAGNSPVPGEFPTQRPVTRRFDVFFDLRLNKRLSKQSWGWWLETPSRSLWRHCNDLSFQLFVVSFLPCKYQAYNSRIPGPERNKGFNCLFNISAIKLFNLLNHNMCIF